jgi:hypothetical protein
MPFTPSHAAIVLPLLKHKNLSATALIIGSMAPDFAYFFTMSTEGKYSHSLLSILYFNIPVTFFLAWLFHEVAKKNLIGSLPAFIRERFWDTYSFAFIPYIRAHFISFALSAALGTVSHIFWDSFTHAEGYFAQVLPFYKDVVVPYKGVRYPLFYALQYISSIVGLIFIVLYILSTERRPFVLPQSTVLYWFTLVAIAGIVVAVRFTLYAKTNDSEGTRIIGCISGLCLGCVFSGLLPLKKNELT